MYSDKRNKIMKVAPHTLRTKVTAKEQKEHEIYLLKFQVSLGHCLSIIQNSHTQLITFLLIFYL